jgi:imidazolonepropionase-like amidohydrolase
VNPNLKKIFHLLFQLIFVVLLFGCTSQNSTKNVTVFEGATLIIGDGSQPIKNSMVIIKGNTIIKVGRGGEINYPNNAEVINLDGKWIIPGLMDLHFHIKDQDQLQALETLLQFGVTTFRNTETTPEFGVELREKLAKGEILGPRMFTAGELIDLKGAFWSGKPNCVDVATPEEMRDAVRRQAELGVDYIKLYAHLDPSLVEAGIKEAKVLGLKTIGHLGKTGWGQAANMGIDAVTHSGTAAPTWELVTTQHQNMFKDFFAPHQKPEFDHTLFGPWYEFVDLNGPEIEEMISSIVDNKVEVNPTLVIVEVFFWGDDPKVRKTLIPEYAPSSLRSKWKEGRHPYSASWPKESMDEAKKVFKINQEIVKRLYDAGALLTTGTDFPVPWCTPGVALHHEMLLIHNSGIPAIDVITMATRNGAEALGILDEVGTITVGKKADLLILNADPIQNIMNTTKIEKVYFEGKLVHQTANNN